MGHGQNLLIEGHGQTLLIEKHDLIFLIEGRGQTLYGMTPVPNGNGCSLRQLSVQTGMTGC